VTLGEVSRKSRSLRLLIEASGSLPQGQIRIPPADVVPATGGSGPSRRGTVGGSLIGLQSFV
jgi:hypothetical protein